MNEGQDSVQETSRADHKPYNLGEVRHVPQWPAWSEWREIIAKRCFLQEPVCGESLVQERDPTHRREILMLFKNIQKREIVFCALLKSHAL